MNFYSLLIRKKRSERKLNAIRISKKIILKKDKS
jgi:hypothetical protein